MLDAAEAWRLPENPLSLQRKKIEVEPVAHSS